MGSVLWVLTSSPSESPSSSESESSGSVPRASSSASVSPSPSESMSLMTSDHVSQAVVLLSQPAMSLLNFLVDALVPKASASSSRLVAPVAEVRSAQGTYQST